MGGITFTSQLFGSIIAALYALACSYLVYTVLSKTVGIRLNKVEEFIGPDLSIHRIDAYPEDQVK